MNRNALGILIAGVLCFAIGAISGPVFGDDSPLWVFTWLGIVLVIVGAVLLIVRRRRA